MTIHVEIPVFILIIMLVPLLIDGFLQLLSSYESDNFLRLITGFFFGLSLPMLIHFIVDYGL